MQNYINTDKEPTESDRVIIDDLVTRITGKFEMDKIFARRLELDSEFHCELLFILRDQDGLSLKNVQTIILMFFRGIENFSFTIAFTNTVKEAIKHGRFYYFSLCRPEYLIYNHPNPKSDIYPDPILHESITEKMQVNYNSTFKRITGFLEGAKSYYQQEQYEFATFMLHQVMELSYRGIEKQLIHGAEKRVHSITQHQKYIKKHVPVLGSLFSESSIIEMEALKALDDSYTDLRYRGDFKISKELVDMIFQKVEQIQDIIPIVLNEMVSLFASSYSCEVQINEVQQINVDEKHQNSESPLAYVIKKITSYIETEAIFCFGKRASKFTQECIFQCNIFENTNHYNLLIITSQDEEDGGILQNLINNDPNINFKVTLLIHNIDSVRSSTHQNNLFFKTVLEKGEAIYFSNNSFKIDFEEPLEEDILTKTLKANVDNYYLKARGFIEICSDSAWDYGHYEISIFLLAQGFEQLCLGFINQSMAYTPQVYTLSQLYDFCIGISPKFRELFGLHSSENNQIFDILNNNLRNVQDDGALKDDVNEIFILRKRCLILLESFEKLYNMKASEKTTPA